MSAMSEMSKAIRSQLEAQGPTLADIPAPALAEITHILGAYYLDLKAELDRREQELLRGNA